MAQGEARGRARHSMAARRRERAQRRRREKKRRNEKQGRRQDGERGREKEQSDRRCAPSSWPGTTTKEALSRGCSFGQCLLFLPRSLPSLHSFSLALIPPFLPSRPFYRLLALSFPRFLSHPALFRRSPHSAALPCCIAHTRHGLPAKSLCHLANERPSAARIIPRRARSRKISSSRPVTRWPPSSSSSSSSSAATGSRAARSGTADHSGNIVRPENERERGAFGNVHSYRGLKARSVGKEEAFSFELFPPAAARNSVKVPRPFATDSGALSTARRR